MNQTVAAEVVNSAIAMPGYVGKILIPGQGPFAIIAGPKATAEHAPMSWNRSMKRVEGAMSFYDGLANTLAMAEAGSKLAQWALDMGMYLPSRDELELCYRARKPSSDENWCFRGDNPSSVPIGYAYMPNDPAQTEIAEYRKGGIEAFEPAPYWSSTQSAGDEGYAWSQFFSGGGQYYGPKSSHFRARAVSRITI
jgi:hypothetical protein